MAVAFSEIDLGLILDFRGAQFSRLDVGQPLGKPSIVSPGSFVVRLDGLLKTER